MNKSEREILIEKINSCGDHVIDDNTFCCKDCGVFYTDYDLLSNNFNGNIESYFE